MRRAVALWGLLLVGCGPPPGEPAPAWPPFTVRGRWADPGALRWWIEAGDGPVDAAVLRRVVEDALRVWAQHPAVGFRPASDFEDSHIVYRWGATAGDGEIGGPFGRDTSVAVAGPVGARCVVQLDRGQRYREAGAGDVSLAQAVVHETGHALGLGHSADPTAVMYAQREVAGTAPNASDWAGLHSLYGGGTPGAGDIDFGPRVPALRRLAPPGRTEWMAADLDGNGAAELLLWSGGDRGEAALMALHFATGPVLQRTGGPWLGIVGPGTSLRVGGQPGRRWLDVRWPDGTVVRRALDARGRPGAAERGEPWPTRAVGVHSELSADLDGDGVAERIERR